VQVLGEAVALEPAHRGLQFGERRLRRLLPPMTRFRQAL
jgi:hypothetical protein